MRGAPVLQVSNLSIMRTSGASLHQVIRDVSFEVREGSVLGIIGESGAGKTSLALALIGLLDAGSTDVSGRIVFKGTNLLDLTEAEFCKVRGAGIGMIFQDSTGALDPSMRVIDQVAEAIMIHRNVNLMEARQLATESLSEAGVAQDVLRDAPYAHQLSGGLCQRSMIAAALAAEPDIIIADEPTSSLDVTLQAQIISLLNRQKQKTGMAIVFISHDLALVAGFADEILVLHEGEAVEQGKRDRLLSNPAHAYTKQLISAWDSGYSEGGATFAAR